MVCLIRLQRLNPQATEKWQLVDNDPTPGCASPGRESAKTT